MAQALNSIPIIKRKRFNKRIFRMNLVLYTMFVPVMVQFFIFHIIPMIGYIMAFQDYKMIEGISGSPWTGLYNFNMMFTNPVFRRIVFNTLKLSLLGIAVSFPMPIIIALLLNEVGNMGYKKLTQTAVFMPHFLNWTVVGTFVIMLFSEETGLVNTFIAALGGQRRAFLYNENSWLVIYLATGVWKGAGFGSVLYLAAIAGVSLDQYEAATLDGATRIQKTWYITLPSILPIIMIKLIMSVESVMNVGFEQIYVMTNGAVKNSTNVIGLYSYNSIKEGRNFGVTTAMNFVEAGMGFLMMVIVNRLCRPTGHQLW